LDLRSFAILRGTPRVAVAWSREAREASGGRVFYTPLGGSKDFDEPNYRQLLVNALFWLTERDAAKMKK
jgi:type 1 glutamine amidotransferase